VGEDGLPASVASDVAAGMSDEGRHSAPPL
jgi:hypothetical protein